MRSRTLNLRPVALTRVIQLIQLILYRMRQTSFVFFLRLPLIFLFSIPFVSWFRIIQLGALAIGLSYLLLLLLTVALAPVN